jgi:aminopeptidase N
MRRHTARPASGLATRLARRALIAFVAVAALAVPLAGQAVDRTGVPPPIPTPEAREAFIRSHEAGLKQWSEEPPRAVHDEYDVIHYDVDLNLNITARVIHGVVTVDATAKVANLLVLPIDLFSPMVVDSVKVDGAPVTYSHTGGVIRANLPHALQPEDPVTLRVTYHGTPQYTGVPFRWSTHGASIPMVLSYSEPTGAPAWWVCKDDPKDKATFSIHVTAPDNLSTVSNGVLTSVVMNGNGTATYNWNHDYPMSPYLFSIATTNFEHWTEVYTALDGSTTMNVDYYAYPEDRADAEIDWSRNIQMMEYYASIFGEYPFLREKYAIAEFQHPGAMEHQTATSMGYPWITGNNANDSVVAHELSHMWVGDMITMRLWNHAWTKEGFATLCEALYFEDRYGADYYHEYMESMNILNYAARQIYNINPPLDATIYYKGAWVLHMLRHVIGDAAFFAGCRGYTNDPDLMYGNNLTEDLRDAFEAASGMDLDWFFQEWIYRPGYPQFTMFWNSVPGGGGHNVTLNLRQDQTVGPTFKMPIDVQIDTQAGEENFVVWDSLQTQSFVLHVAAAPIRVTIDPDNWLIKEILNESAVPGEAPAATGPVLWCEPNPFNRSTTIGFSMAEAGPVRLRVFDLSGRLVRSLLDSPLGPGEHRVTWDGRGENGSILPAGLYLQRLDNGGRSSRSRVLLIH